MSWSVSSVRGDGRSACETCWACGEVEEGRGPLAVCRRRSHMDCVRWFPALRQAGHDLEHHWQAPESWTIYVPSFFFFPIAALSHSLSINHELRLTPAKQDECIKPFLCFHIPYTSLTLLFPFCWPESHPLFRLSFLTQGNDISSSTLISWSYHSYCGNIYF